MYTTIPAMLPLITKKTLLRCPASTLLLFAVVPEAAVAVLAGGTPG